MTPCPDKELMLQALADSELDAANTLAIEAHLETCEACAGYLATLHALGERLADPAMSIAAPTRLKARIEDMIARESRPRSHGTGRRFAAAGWAGVGAAAAMAASLLIVQLSPAPASLQDQLVASHVRSLQAGHLIDVATSDRHVVKPWFNGRIDFAPPVVDLAAQGFPLAGGRLDYVDGHEAAALVYKRRLHTINLFVMPARPQPFDWRLFHPTSSYSVIHWRRGSLDFWAVSDLGGTELEQFHQLFAAQAAG